ncbi:hypothetical protein KP509_1Z028000 [Ceratopteris richardii]|nr:hypothetical protein KP509_1Z028000 [Ceratopteris richardii]
MVASANESFVLFMCHSIGNSTLVACATCNMFYYVCIFFCASKSVLVRCSCDVCMCILEFESYTVFSFSHILIQNRIFHHIHQKWVTVSKDQSYAHRAAHWSDIHRILYDSLPNDVVKWGHEVDAMDTTADGMHVNVHFKKGDSSVSEMISANLVIAADGSMSETRRQFLPHENRRYCGYYAWRGVLDASSEKAMNVKATLRQQYPDLGHCLYFDIANNAHAVLYELKGGRLNWLWYVNQPVPDLSGSSVTAKADDERIERMRMEAKHVWSQELASLMQLTPAPFINAIFDREPLKQLVWGRVVLVGEAAHPTSPHGLRSTNMSIMDAAVLGECMTNCGWQVDMALKEFEALRLPVVSQQVLFSRHLGQVKQGLTPVQLPDLLISNDFEWERLLQRNMHTQSSVIENHSKGCINWHSDFQI